MSPEAGPRQEAEVNFRGFDQMHLPGRLQPVSESKPRKAYFRVQSDRGPWLGSSATPRTWPGERGGAGARTAAPAQEAGGRRVPGQAVRRGDSAPARWRGEAAGVRVRPRGCHCSWIGPLRRRSRAPARGDLGRSPRHPRGSCCHSSYLWLPSLSGSDTVFHRSRQGICCKSNVFGLHHPVASRLAGQGP